MLRDAAQPVYEQVDWELLAVLQAADLGDLITAHRASPFGPHPDPLARVLNYFRRKPTLGKYVIIRLPGATGWQLATITGRRREGSVSVRAGLYDSPQDAEHAVFLARLRDAGLLAVDAGIGSE